MKALVTAFALLSFVAASSIPVAAYAQAESAAPAKAKHHHKGGAHKAKSHKKAKEPAA